AWQLWMQRLDPAEMRSSALYSGAMIFAGGHPVYVIAVSGAPAIIQYVRAAFAAPDLLAYPGIAPISQRFVEAQEMPREQLGLRGYISAQGQFRPIDRQEGMEEDASGAGWNYEGRHTPPSGAFVSANLEREATSTFQAQRLDGATRIMLRLWNPSHATPPRNDRGRRILFAVIGTVLILASIGLLASYLAGRTLGQSSPTTPQQQAPALVVAPLALRASCTPGILAQFTISNNGTQSLIWSSNAAQFEPPLSFSAISGTIDPGGSEIVQFTTSDYVVTTSTDIINLTSNGGTAKITITVGGCTPPTQATQ
ncbi:MAG TPA: hypothetical protein VKB76_14375, partial [Ktedonobacterales bacterium]|nr:hypothetical protein [Ktedonobacterales bacterium]